MFEARSALTQVLPLSGRDGADGRRRVLLGELFVGSLVQLGIYSGQAARAASAAIGVLGGPLPESATQASCHGPHTVFRIAHDQFLIRTPDLDLARGLRAAVPTDAASLTLLDGARTCVGIAGPAAREVLARLVAVDVDPAIFRVGRFAQTPIHHVGGLLYRAAVEQYEFLALRTYAQATWEAIEDAARFFGYDLIGQSAGSHPFLKQY